MVLGFALSAYAIVANDSIQTLGTFIASNKERPWWQLWFFSSSILVAVLLYSWLVHNGDPSYGRLDTFPYDPNVYGLIHVIPPIALLILTRYGMPVSTTFLILTFFDFESKNLEPMIKKSLFDFESKNLGPMIEKSLFGYGLAFVCALGVFWVVHKLLLSVEGPEEVHAHEPLEEREHHTPLWSFLLLASTAFLWSQWLIQDLANLFIYFPHSPEPLPVGWLILSLALMVGMQALIFKDGGGEIQEIVNQKSGSRDMREATIINLVYGVVILFFKEYSNMPMSTTWVFLGLLAGREVSYRLAEGAGLRSTWRMIFMDLGKATLGLVVSVVLAVGLPYLLS